MKMKIDLLERENDAASKEILKRYILHEYDFFSDTHEKLGVLK